MEDIIRKRKPLRMTFTKTIGSLFDELEKQTPDSKNIKQQCFTLDRVFNKMKECDELILNDIKTDVEFEAEYNKIEEFDQKMDLARAESEIFFSKQIVLNEAASSVTLSPNTKRRMRLPKIELLRFGGDLKDYLGFWSQFQRIHTDSELAPEDKYQYLLQCVTHGSRAREVIESFPPTAENYKKAIDALKSRFGRDELLIEYYVRELLTLVVKNATEKRGNLNIANLYDKLESHLRSLESLGLASEKYEAILFPLVESCIPEDLMRVWLRNPIQSGVAGEMADSFGNKLKNLLSFLKREVEGEERLQLARNGFDGARTRLRSKKEQHIDEVIPTASTLVSSDISQRHPFCVFCDKTHESRDCFIAQSWSLDKKKEVLSNKKACYICFKANHRAKECKAKLKCMMCSKRHHVIMCFELPVNKRELTAKERVDSSNVLVAKEGNEVLLQTLLSG
nr:uncharacterized protein LOC122271712 [Parasteatoda tepidariorum]